MALIDEPAAHRVGVRHDRVRLPADETLRARLERVQISPGVANGGDDSGDLREERRGYTEDVGIEVVGMHDADAVAAEIAGEPELLPERRPLVEARDRVFDERDAELVHALEELSLPLQAGEMELEPALVQTLRGEEELFLRSSDGEDVDELQDLLLLLEV